MLSIGAELRSVCVSVIRSTLRLTWIILMGSALRAAPSPLLQQPVGMEYESLP